MLKLPDGRDWLWANLGLILMDGAILNKSLIQFSVDEWYCVHSRGWGHCSVVLGPGAHKVVFVPSEHLWQVWGLILNMIFPLILSCWVCSFALGHGISFFGGIQHSPVDGYSVASCNFRMLAREDACTYSIQPSYR